MKEGIFRVLFHCTLSVGQRQFSTASLGLYTVVRTEYSGCPSATVVVKDNYAVGAIFRSMLRLEAQEKYSIYSRIDYS